MAYGSREERDREEECDSDDSEEDDEEQKCFLSNGDKIDCKYCMQDGGCRKPKNIIQNKLRIFISSMYKKIIVFMGW